MNTPTGTAPHRSVDESKGINVTNPATGEVIDIVPRGTAIDATHAVEAAKRAAPGWSSTPAHERAAVLMKFADRLEDQTEDLAVLLTRENGKTLHHARKEIATGARLFRVYAQEALRAYGLSIPGDAEPGYEDDLIITRRYPYGVMVSITPFNFPVSLFSTKVAPALATGNVVIAKPSEDAPLTVLAVARLLHDAGLPADVLQVVTGTGPELGVALLDSPQVDLVSFTGSTATGQAIATQRAPHITPTHLELGGNDPIVVLEDADLDLAIEHAWFGRILENGQCCAANKRFIVDSRVHDEFVERLRERLAATEMGDPLDDVDLGPLIHEDAAERVIQQMKATISSGAAIVQGSVVRDGTFVEPSVLIDVTSDMPIARGEEVFGPVFPIIRVSDADEAVEVANNSNLALHGAVFSRDVGRAINVADRIDGGLVAVNGTGLYKPDAIPFGGWKQSGLGREGTTAMFHQYTQEKTIAIRGVL